MSHVTHMDKPCLVYESVMSHIRMSHVTCMNESCHVYEWVVSRVWMSHVSHMGESCLTHEWVTSHILMSHVTHMYAWWLMWCMSHTLTHVCLTLSHMCVTRIVAHASCHTCRWVRVTWRIWISHVTHPFTWNIWMCDTHGSLMSHTWMSDVILGWVISNSYQTHLKLMWKSCESLVTLMWNSSTATRPLTCMSHVTLVNQTCHTGNESCHTCEWVMSHVKESCHAHQLLWHRIYMCYELIRHDVCVTN